MVSFRAGVQSRIFPDAPTGLVYPGDPGVSRSTYSSDLNDFSPRFGFTWDVLHNGALSVRGGFGLLYDVPFEEILIFASLNSPPYSISPSTQSTDYANPWLGSRVHPIPQPFPRDPPKPGDRVDFRSFAPMNFAFLEPGFRTPYVQQWNLQVQRQLPKDWFLEVGCVGNAGRKLSNEGEYNYAVPDQDQELMQSAHEREPSIREATANPINATIVKIAMPAPYDMPARSGNVTGPNAVLS